MKKVCIFQKTLVPLRACTVRTFKNGCTVRTLSPVPYVLLIHTIDKVPLRLSDILCTKILGASLSAVGEHLKADPDHTVNFQSPDILGASPYRSKLLIKEALYIQQHQPSLNEQMFSKKLFIFNI